MMAKTTRSSTSETPQRLGTFLLQQQRGGQLIRQSLAPNKHHEFVIRLESRHLLGELFHRVDGIHR